MSSSFTAKVLAIVAAVVVIAAVASNGKDGGRRRASIAVEKADGTPCGTTTCAVGELCCDWTTCYNPSAGETCCAAAEGLGYGLNSAICSSTQTCCGGGTAAMVTCFDPTNETCCAEFDTIATACGLGDTCCKNFAPPTMFHCCGGEKHTTCCKSGEGSSANSICCAEGTTCCVDEVYELAMCCNATETCGVNGCLGPH